MINIHAIFWRNKRHQKKLVSDSNFFNIQQDKFNLDIYASALLYVLIFRTFLDVNWEKKLSEKFREHQAWLFVFLFQIVDLLFWFKSLHFSSRQIFHSFSIDFFFIVIESTEVVWNVIWVELIQVSVCVCDKLTYGVSKCLIWKLIDRF